MLRSLHGLGQRRRSQLVQRRRRRPSPSRPSAALFCRFFRDVFDVRTAPPTRSCLLVGGHRSIRPSLPRTLPPHEVLGRTPKRGYSKNPELNKKVLEVLAGLGRDDLLRYDLPTGSGEEAIGAYCRKVDNQFQPSTTVAIPSDCLMATLGDMHTNRGLRIGCLTGFSSRFDAAKNSVKIEKSAGLSQAYSSVMRRLYPRGTGVNPESKDEIFHHWLQEGEDALERNTWLRLLAFAVAPLEVLLNSEALVRLGMLSPSATNVKD